jgi:hypothetical protein
MRKYYRSGTLRNFFLVFRLSVLKKTGESYDFQQILDITKEKFKSELTDERLQAILNSNVALEKNIAARFIPLALKYAIIKLANSANASVLSTTNFSNLGTVTLPESMSKHVRGFDITFVLGKRSTHNLALITYSGKTSISLTRRVVEDELDKTFFSLLSEDGIGIVRSGNEWEKYVKDVKFDEPMPEDPGSPDSSGFPVFERQKRRDRRLAKISSASAASLIVFSVLANIFVWNENFWSAIATAAILYVWILGLITLKKTLHVGLKMMLHAISLSGLLLVINTFAYTAESIHRVTWAISYGIPGILAGFIIAVNVTMFSHRQNRRDFLLYQISLSVMGIIPLILVLTGVTSPMWPGITVAVLSYLTIIGLVIFAKRIMLSEFRKKFHI